ncbi:DNA primase [Streptomyces sp. YIM S03343]
MNRTAIGLAIGAGYLLGRTRKLKMALAAGSLVAGKRLHLSPGAVGELLNRQLKDNPQFKEIGDELREDLRGVGKAASGALVERQISVLADRLHDRTAGVRDQLSGTVPGAGGVTDEQHEEHEEHEEPSGEEDTRREEEDTGREKGEQSHGRRRSRRDEDSGQADEDGRPPRRRAPGNVPATKTAGKAPAAKKATARKTAGGARRAVREGGRQGGDER